MTDHVVVTFYDPINPPILKSFRSEDAAIAYAHGVKFTLEHRGLAVYRYSYRQCVQTIFIHD
jgi:hypothetical protein